MNTRTPEAGSRTPEAGSPVRLPEQHWLDSALAVPNEQVARYVAMLRRRHPHATPGELAEILTNTYRTAVSTSGGTFGVVAARRDAGRAAALALTAGSLASFLAASGLYCLALAYLHGVPTDDLPQRRALLSTALLGERGPQFLQQKLKVTAPTWATVLLTRVPTAQVKSVSRLLRRRLATSALAGGSAALLTHTLPYGVGAVLGVTAARTMADRLIETLSDGFGPPPDEFPAPDHFPAPEQSPTGAPAEA